MAVIQIVDTDSFDEVKIKINQISSNEGDLSLLSPSEPDLVSAINNLTNESRSFVILAICLS